MLDQKRFLSSSEVIMAKRRNLKKEKAERNKAYARKFRKTSTGRFGRYGKRYQSNDKNRKPENESEVESAT
ncbi:MAG: hypothetical protein F6K10_29210 [Moorea sp. SIO2B7]|nr:hypothetical protein [Moorena sp. SIO2B7]